MKILVTGGAGFIGGNFVHYMVNKYPEDMIVNLDYAKRAYEAYAAHSPDRVTLHIIEDGAHGFQGPHDDLAKQYLEEFAKL